MQKKFFCSAAYGAKMIATANVYSDVYSFIYRY